MEPRVRRRLIAPSADALGHLPTRPPQETVDPGPHRVAVRPRPFELEDDEVPGPLRLVVEVDQRLVLRDDERVEPAVVIEVADGQAAAEVQRAGTGGRPAPRRRSAGRPGCRAGAAAASSRGTAAGRRGRARWRVIRSSQPSLLASKKATPKPSSGRLGAVRPIVGGVVGEEAAAQVAVEGRRLAEVVGHGQVGQAVAVEVAAGDPHPGLVIPVRGARRPPRSPPSPRTGTRPGCGRDSWPSCRWPRRGRSGRRRRGRPRRRPAPARWGRRCRPGSVTSTNRPASLRKTWSGSDGKSSGLHSWTFGESGCSHRLGLAGSYRR